MNKLKERILRTLKSLPGRVVYDPPPTKQKQKQKQQEEAEADADDLFFFDAPPSPDSILNPKPHPDDDDDDDDGDGDGDGHHRTLDASYVLVHLPDAPQPIAADAAQPDPNSNSNSNDGDDREEEEEEEEDLLREFEVRCPPRGEEAVVVYTTSLRGIRKTFEDCDRVRLLLRSLRAAFHERDVSMHSGYRDELWAIQGRGAAPPRVFVKGRYVGGAEELIALHEQGKLLPLLRRCGGAGACGGGGGGSCAGCGGATFVVCSRCSGSCKVYDEERGIAIRCAICNENGLVACPLLSVAAAAAAAAAADGRL